MRLKLVAFGGHLFRRSRFEVEPEERFGIGRTDIEPPVRIVDFEAIEFMLFPISIVGASLARTASLSVTAVDLTGMTVALGFRDEAGSICQSRPARLKEGRAGSVPGLAREFSK